MAYDDKPATVACEQQHVIRAADESAKSRGLGARNSTENVVWWSRSDHARTDRWKDRPWLEEEPWFIVDFGVTEVERNLYRAYMMGTYGMAWSVFFNSHNRPGSTLVLKEFDGISNLVYFVSWVVNTPQKILNKMAYISDTGRWYAFADLLLFVFVLAIAEFLLGCVATIGGVVLGTIFNPWDTLVAIPGGILLAIESIVSAVTEYAFGLFRVVFSNWYGILVAIIAVPLSLVPVWIASRLRS